MLGTYVSPHVLSLRFDNVTMIGFLSWVSKDQLMCLDGLKGQIPSLLGGLTTEVEPIIVNKDTKALELLSELIPMHGLRLGVAIWCCSMAVSAKSSSWSNCHETGADGVWLVIANHTYESNIMNML